MKLDKAKLASGDRNELLKLARSIKPTTSLNKAEHPLASQFFADDLPVVTHLSTDELAESLAGAESIEHFRWVETMAAAGYSGIALNRPKASGDVTELGAFNGGVRSGWTPPKNVTVSTKAGKVATTVQFKKAAKATEVSPADTGILVESLKAIIYQLLGADVSAFDPATLKTRITTALKTARPDVRTRLEKALQAA
jgi:hypothetical protein